MQPRIRRYKPTREALVTIILGLGFTKRVYRANIISPQRRRLPHKIDTARKTGTTARTGDGEKHGKKHICLPGTLENVALQAYLSGRAYRIHHNRPASAMLDERTRTEDEARFGTCGAQNLTLLGTKRA